MSKESTIKLLIDMKELADEEQREAINTAVSIMRKQLSIKFNITLLDKMLEEIITEYFSDETIEYGYGMWEVIHAVRARYSDEIETLPK